MKKIFYLSLLFFLIFKFSYSQVPKAFKYQAVARDANNYVIDNQVISLEIAIISNTPDGDIVYKERHQVTTNNIGIFSINIGQGNAITGNFIYINWSLGTYFLNVKMDAQGGPNYLDMGSSQLLSVPFALYADKFNGSIDDDDADPNNEIQTITKNEDNLVELSNGGGSFTDEVNDSDSLPDNELQTISRDGNFIILSNGGGSVMVSDEVNDADYDPTNEIQTISKNGNTVSLSDEGGSFIDDVDDADNNPLNELQIIEKIGNTVYLSPNGGNFIDATEDGDFESTNEIQEISKDGIMLNLSLGGGQISLADNDNSVFNEIQNLTQEGLIVTLSDDGGTINVGDLDNDPTNEIQTIEKDESGNITLSNSVGFVVDETEDDDSDTTNEIQSLSLQGMELSISGGNSVSLSGFSWSHDQGSSEIYYNTGNVGIGTSNPIAGLHINSINGFVSNGILNMGAFPVDGTGVRMMWYPNKSVFRVGYVSGNHWNVDSIGDFSSVTGGKDNMVKGDYGIISGGENNIIKSNYSFIGGGINNLANEEYIVINGGENNIVEDKYSFIGGGKDNKVTKQYSLVGGGSQNHAFGIYSNVLGGQSNTAQENYSLVLGGKSNFAEKNYSIIVGGRENQATEVSTFIGGGQGNIASGTSAVIVGGQNNEAREDYTVIMGGYSNFATSYNTTVCGGSFNNAFGNSSAIMGGNNNFAEGDYSAITGGLGVETNSSYSLSFGRYNLDEGDSVSWVSTDPLFTVGNGSNPVARSNALTLYKDGNLIISGTLTELSDENLKTNFLKMENILEKVLKLDAFYYEFKNKEIYPSGKQIGVTAQNVKKYFPELVNKDLKGNLAVSYGHLSVILLQAVKEQQKIIEEQNEKYQKLEDRIKKLEELIKK
ncbi:MAG: hypothetical protein B6I24_05540 [Bacteroidetes bacterium 4572_128]|nr:MAG: hypothetical protein B6I24_05540 [Bacteroidetes bacterium 4572_128]